MHDCMVILSTDYGSMGKTASVAARFKERSEWNYTTGVTHTVGLNQRHTGRFREGKINHACKDERQNERQNEQRWGWMVNLNTFIVLLKN